MAAVVLALALTALVAYLIGRRVGYHTAISHMAVLFPDAGEFVKTQRSQAPNQ